MHATPDSAGFSHRHARPASLPRLAPVSRPAPSFRTAPLPLPGLYAASVAIGGASIAALDFLFCLAFWWPMGVDAQRVLQGVAAGLLGRAAYAGGAATALLGACGMVLIGCAFVMAYAWAARHAGHLRLHARTLGPAYGLLLYLVMTRIVVPLSAAPEPGRAQLAWALASLPMFAVFGLLAAVFGARALGHAPRSPRTPAR